MSSLSSNPATLADRMKELLSTAKGADIQFLVGEEKKLFRVHKLILMSASDVFEAMFRYDILMPVEVTDVEVGAFKVMLSFIYTDDLSELDGDNAMAVLYAAKKYMVDDLIFHCSRIEIQILPNVFLAYEQASLLKIDYFIHRCLRYICQNAATLFKSDEFLQIDQNLLCELICRDQLAISKELEIWEYALSWADEKCRQNAIEFTGENRRSALGPALFKIRFPLITMETFGKEIVPSGVLTMEEAFGVYQFQCHPNFHGIPRQCTMKFPYKSRICDWNISKGNRGTIMMEIEKLSEFAREELGSSRESEIEVQIKGLPWKIATEKTTENEGTEKCLGFYLWCTASEEDENWSCECSATLRIVSQKSETEDLIGKFNNCVFNNKASVKGR